MQHLLSVFYIRMSACLPVGSVGVSVYASIISCIVSTQIDACMCVPEYMCLCVCVCECVHVWLYVAIAAAEKNVSLRRTLEIEQNRTFITS